MPRPITHVDVLDGIESTIETTETQIYHLKVEFAAHVLSGETLERRLILQQLGILQDNLELLKVRRMFALEMVQ
jgi:hypothetical protein